MSLSVIQVDETDDDAVSAGTTIAKAFPSNLTAGSMLVAWASWDHSGSDPTPTISDSKGNAWSTAQNIIDSATDTQKSCIFFTTAATTSGADTVTVSFGGSTVGGRCLTIFEIGGAASESPAHTGQFQSAPGTSADGVTSGTVSPNRTGNNLVLGICLEANASAGAPNTGSGYTSLGTWVNFHHGGGAVFERAESKTFSGGAATAATFTALGNTRHLTHVLIFSEPASGGTAYFADVGESVSLAESLGAFKSALPSLPETVSLSENAAAQMATTAGLSETVTASDSVAASQGMSPSGLDENVSLNEVAAAVYGGAASLPETVSLSESLAAIYGTVVGLAESVTLSEQLAAFQSMLAALAETVGLAESLAVIYGAVVGLAETVSASEAIDVQGGTGGVDLNETVSVSESVAAQMGTSGAVAETVTLSEAVAASRGMLAALAESLSTLTDALAAVYGAVANLSETVPNDETVGATGGTAGVTLNETVSLAESLAAFSAKTVAVLESITLAESVAARGDASVPLPETVALAEAIAATTTAAVALNESLGAVGESLGAILGRDGSVAETVALLESLATRYDGSLPLAETMPWFEQVTTILGTLNLHVARMPSKGTTSRPRRSGRTKDR